MTDNLAEKKSHTEGRNSNAIGSALCCAFKATANAKPTHNLGKYPPTSAQIETVSEMLAIISKELDIPFDIQHVMTHAEAANNADGVYAHAPTAVSVGICGICRIMMGFGRVVATFCAEKQFGIGKN